jgi:hypothetical protein
MNTDQIIEIFRTHSVDAARLGFNVIVLPEDEWLHIAEHLSQGYSEAYKGWVAIFKDEKNYLAFLKWQREGYSEAEVKELLGKATIYSRPLTDFLLPDQIERLAEYLESSLKQQP